MKYILAAIMFFLLLSCSKKERISSNESTELKIPKRDFLSLKSDTGVLKMPERFNIENRNGKINLSAFLENRYLFQVNELDEKALLSGEAILGDNFNMVIVRPPNKPCLCLDKSKNKVKMRSDDKRSAIFIVGIITCDGIFFDVAGAFTGEIPNSTFIQEE